MKMQSPFVAFDFWQVRNRLTPPNIIKNSHRMPDARRMNEKRRGRERTRKKWKEKKSGWVAVGRLNFVTNLFQCNNPLFHCRTENESKAMYTLQYFSRENIEHFLHHHLKLTHRKVLLIPSKTSHSLDKTCDYKLNNSPKKTSCPKNNSTRRRREGDLYFNGSEWVRDIGAHWGGGTRECGGGRGRMMRQWKKIADEANWKIKLQRRLCRVMTKAASLNFPLIKTFESESKEKKERILYAVLLTSQQKTSALAQP